MTHWRLQVAGDSPSGLSVVEKAQSAVNTVKIITALNEISDILKVQIYIPFAWWLERHAADTNRLQSRGNPEYAAATLS